MLPTMWLFTHSWQVQSRSKRLSRALQQGKPNKTLLKGGFPTLLLPLQII